MHQLPLVPFRQRFDRLELEYNSTTNQQVERIGLAEILEPHVHRHLAPRVGNAVRDLPLVNLLVEQPSEFTVNVEDMTHDLIRAGLEFLISHPPYVSPNLN